MFEFIYHMFILTGVMCFIPVIEKSEKINSFLDFIFDEV